MLSHVECIADGISGFVRDDHTCGVGIWIPVFDLESNAFNQKLNFLDQALRSIPEQFAVRIIHTRKTSYSGISDSVSQRGADVAKLGFTESRCVLLIESRGLGTFWPRINRSSKAKPSALTKIYDWIKSCQLIQSLDGRVLDQEEIRSLFEADPRGSTTLSFIDEGDCLTGAVRIIKPGVAAIGAETFALLSHSIPTPWSMACVLRRVPPVKASLKLRAILGKARSGSEVGSGQRQATTEDALERVDMQNEGLFEIELVLKVSRQSEESLREALDHVKRMLDRLGEAQIETVGLIPSLRAFVPGERVHVAFLELGDGLTHYLPIASFGETPSSAERARTALFHRKDRTLHSFDLFSRDYLAFNALITGSTGSGKSVLTGLLTRCLFKDPDIHLIKIDVGSSYKRECEELGGREISLDLNQPMGLDPFFWVGTDFDLETVEVISELLCSILLETNEAELPRAIRSIVETEIRAFLEAVASPTFEGFLKHAKKKKLIRLSLLERFGIDGLYKNLFLGMRSTDAVQERYLYFNFENLVSAKSVDFSKAAMGAVIAFTNLKMLHLSRSKGRLVLICDETKFFIEKELKFFLLTTANFRKFGHSTILVGTNIRDFDRDVDSGLILNSPIRFFLSGDVDEEYLRTRFKLSDRHISVVTANQAKSGSYRECVLQDDTGTRSLLLELSEHERILLSSRKEDRDQYSRLKSELPGLTQVQLMQVIEWTHEASSA